MKGQRVGLNRVEWMMSKLEGRLTVCETSQLWNDWVILHSFGGAGLRLVCVVVGARGLGRDYRAKGHKFYVAAQVP